MQSIPIDHVSDIYILGDYKCGLVFTNILYDDFRGIRDNRDLLPHPLASSFDNRSPHTLYSLHRPTARHR